ncbi:hypothetical protein HOO54_12720 [Bacillus sp. WMMC1349]|uniref:hypothetical protein n=1 Tax=Bacillus sp. WMMC1349 TaxID=2736254 RepID=UPI0015582A60|nr:hypothetical protein [Bacillus sp. WMMC1349]NPC93070.1 hypothetical protein [Bacillus sp. WMMC1349]
MKPESFLNLQPLKFLDGWTIVLNELMLEKYLDIDSEKEKTLLLLENQKRNASIIVLGKNNNYMIKTINLETNKVLSEELLLEFHHLVVKLELMIWDIGSDLNGKEIPNVLSMKIPAGWSIDYLSLKNTDPRYIDANDDAWLFDFNQDLLQITHKSKGLLLDIGWYPEGDSAGGYGIVLIRNENWEQPLEDTICNNPSKLINQLDKIFLKVLHHIY